MKRVAKGAVIVIMLLCATLQGMAQKKISVLDIASDYGVPASLITDTNLFVNRITNDSRNYVSLASECTNLSTRIQTMLVALRSDYPHRDGLIIIDEERAIYDYDKYESALQQLAIVAGRYGHYFLTMESTRQKMNADEALSAQEEDLRNLQNKLNDQASTLKNDIDIIHDSITNICLNTPNISPVVAKERKDIYYAYMSIYNSVSNLPQNATENTLKELNDLLWMQKDLLINVISDNNYSNRIEAFQQQLKEYSADRATDVYRSYQRNFTHTSVPIYFNSIDGYRLYVTKLNNIVQVQRHYIDAINLRDTILKQSDEIQKLYDQHYKEIEDSYFKLHSTIQMIPAFNRIEESSTFIANMQHFIALQHNYINNYYWIEKMRATDETIAKQCPKSCTELCKVYNTLPKTNTLIPDYTKENESENYQRVLLEYDKMQKLFTTIISLRDSIDRADKYITSSPNAGNIFIEGYKGIRASASFSAILADEDNMNNCITQLEEFIETQQMCVNAIKKCDEVAENDKTINTFAKKYPNIVTTYSLLRKDYTYTNPIGGVVGVQDFHVRQLEIIAIQKRFLNIIHSNQADDIDMKMYGLRDITQIKKLFHL